MSNDEPVQPGATPAGSGAPSGGSGAAPNPAGAGSDQPQLTVNEWLDRVRVSLGSMPDLALSGIERRLLLDLARIAAHGSERVAAPLSTYLAGIALAGLSPEERAQRLAAIVRELEAGLG